MRHSTDSSLSCCFDDALRVGKIKERSTSWLLLMMYNTILFDYKKHAFYFWILMVLQL